MNNLKPLTKEQLEQAEAIITADLGLDGVIRVWKCGIHGQKALTYNVSPDGVQVRCLLCDSVNNWSLPEKQEKAKRCLCCNLPLTEKELSENPEQICDQCYEIGDVKDPQEY